MVAENGLHFFFVVMQKFREIATADILVNNKVQIDAAI